MKVAVAIPVYNVEKFVERSLRSYFSQTVASQIRYVIVDDCPTDNTMRIVDRVIAEFPNLDITVLNHPCNKGLAAARNTAIEYLKTTDADYVINLDSDDFAEPDMVERMSAAARENDADMVWCDYFELNPGHEACIRHETPRNKDGYISGFLEESQPPFMWCKMIKVSLFKDNHLRWIPRADLNEDKMMTLKLAWHAERIVHLPAAFYHYDKTNSGSIIHTYNPNRKDIEINLKEIADLLEANGAADKFDKSMGIAKLIGKRPLINVDVDLWRTTYLEANKHIRQRNIPLKFKVKYLFLASDISLVRNMTKLALDLLRKISR